METIHPVEGSFGSEFPAICNYCWVGGLKSQDVESLWEIFAFFKKTTHYGKIFKILLRKFLVPHRSTLCSNFVKFFRKIGEIVRYLPDKTKLNFACFSNCRCCADRAQKICQGQPKQCTQSAPDFIHIGSRWSYSLTREHRQIAL